MEGTRDIADLAAARLTALYGLPTGTPGRAPMEVVVVRTETGRALAQVSAPEGPLHAVSGVLLTSAESVEELIAVLMAELGNGVRRSARN